MILQAEGKDEEGYRRLKQKTEQNTSSCFYKKTTSKAVKLGQEQIPVLRPTEQMVEGLNGLLKGQAGRDDLIRTTGWNQQISFAVC